MSNAAQPDATLNNPGPSKNAGTHARALRQLVPPSVLIDEQGNILHLSEGAGSFLEAPSGEPSRNILSHLATASRPELRAALDTASQSGQPVQMHGVNITRAGRDLTIDVTVQPFTTEEGARLMLVLFADVNSVHHAHSQVRVNEERFSTAANATVDFAIMTLDPQGIITAWNTGATRLFGWDEKEAVGQPGSIIFTPDDIARGAHLQEQRQAREEGRAEDERWHMRKDGSVFFCSGVMTAIGPGASQGFAKIARDATRRKHAAAAQETQLALEQQASRQAQAINRMKDEFLAVMSHELKHPLNLIHLNAEMLMRLPETQQLPAVMRAGNTIRQAAANQAKIIDDLLDLSRINTGKLTLNVQPLDLRQAVEPIVSAAASQAHSAGVELQAAMEEEPLIVLADTVRIEQITWNLLNNAVKFSSRGASIRFELAKEDNEAVVVVSDTGRGIDPAFLPQIFDMFSQERTNFSTESRGLGIGLSLVRDLVQAHGGRVKAHSRGLGQGATFTVWLPLHDATPGTAGAQNGEAGGKLQGLRILLVDDSEDTLTVLGGLLRLEQAEVDTAASGAKALELLDKDAAYDLLVSDLGMDEMDGCELIVALRKGSAAPRIPAIALSGFGRDADVQRALAAGFDAHLSKPASVVALRETWQQVRGKR